MNKFLFVMIGMMLAGQAQATLNCTSKITTNVDRYEVNISNSESTIYKSIGFGEDANRANAAVATCKLLLKEISCTSDGVLELSETIASSNQVSTQDNHRPFGGGAECKRARAGLVFEGVQKLKDSK